METNFEPSILVEKHTRFFERLLKGIPGSYGSQETNLLTLLYFCVSGLDLMKADDILQKHRSKIISFVNSCLSKRGGFVGNPTDAYFDAEKKGQFTGPNIAMTFAALNIFLIFDAELPQTDRQAVARMLKDLQTSDGSFAASLNFSPTNTESNSTDSEADMRFVYCASVICFLLRTWDCIDVNRMLSFIWRCKTYEGGFAQVPGAECHGGSTFCAVSSLYLVHLAAEQNQALPIDTSQLTKIRSLFDKRSWGSERMNLVRWCVMRQRRGFCGRPNKPDDTCYTFWIGATLQMLGADQFVDRDLLVGFCSEAQDSIIGGFGKWPHTKPDPLHAYLCLMGLSLFLGKNEKGDVGRIGASMRKVFPALNVCENHFVSKFGALP